MAPPIARDRSLQAGAYEADAGTRTPDPIITSDVLYQLSYVGGATPRGRGRQG
jgi:hypothetical protein